MTVGIFRCQCGDTATRFLTVCEKCASKLEETAPSASSNSDYTAALVKVKKIIHGRGDTVTKVGKVSDVLASLNLPKAANCT